MCAGSRKIEWSRHFLAAFRSLGPPAESGKLAKLKIVKLASGGVRNAYRRSGMTSAVSDCRSPIALEIVFAIEWDARRSGSSAKCE